MIGAAQRMLPASATTVPGAALAMSAARLTGVAAISATSSRNFFQNHRQMSPISAITPAAMAKPGFMMLPKSAVGGPA